MQKTGNSPKRWKPLNTRWKLLMPTGSLRLSNRFAANLRFTRPDRLITKHPRRSKSAVTLPGDADRRSDVIVVGQLLEHKIGNVGPRNPIRPKIIPDVATVPIFAARRRVRQHRRTHNHPIRLAFFDQFFLTDLVVRSPSRPTLLPTPSELSQTNRGTPQFFIARRIFAVPFDTTRLG